ncbi:transcriptional regulator [Erythrobacter sp. F6033]|uniref:P-II family nitrogen regulator n=1 Tax=Erythrobacter sp. F6033 TaxID=2926401 RepID=UPI001FF3DAE3|nr:transcriptional regulator [Erythrobacter sp. F6033]MCK0128342.1 transcriptional regulator [Erythrobacter sp. F6033]
MIETVTRKRIEILADTQLQKRVTDAIEKAGITGWTIVPVTSGKGREGAWREERVMGTDKVFVLTIAAEDKASALAETLAPMLTRYGFIFSMWDVQVIRGERF